MNNNSAQTIKQIEGEIHSLTQTLLYLREESYEDSCSYQYLDVLRQLEHHVQELRYHVENSPFCLRDNGNRQDVLVSCVLDK